MCEVNYSFYRCGNYEQRLVHFGFIHNVMMIHNAYQTANSISVLRGVG